MPMMSWTSRSDRAIVGAMAVARQPPGGTPLLPVAVHCRPRTVRAQANPGRHAGGPSATLRSAAAPT
jgi:hypothetical protein